MKKKIKKELLDCLYWLTFAIILYLICGDNMTGRHVLCYLLGVVAYGLHRILFFDKEKIYELCGLSNGDNK